MHIGSINDRPEPVSAPTRQASSRKPQDSCPKLNNPSSKLITASDPSRTRTQPPSVGEGISDTPHLAALGVGGPRSLVEPGRGLVHRVNVEERDEVVALQAAGWRVADPEPDPYEAVVVHEVMAPAVGKRRDVDRAAPAGGEVLAGEHEPVRRRPDQAGGDRHIVVPRRLEHVYRARPGQLDI